LIPQTTKYNRNLSDNYKHAIAVINTDREKHKLLPILLSNNRAAQSHAEDILRRKLLSHWTTDGMKPYMSYSINGGTGYVKQNVSYVGISNSSIDPIRSIDDLEYAMMYKDSESQWGHRDNILDKYHTHVSIGIAYDDFYFAFVQNFEDNYVHLNKPIIQPDSRNRKNIEISGSIMNNNKLESFSIFYDEVPSRFLYEQHKNDRSYGLGKFIAAIVKPLPSNYYYLEPSTHELIQADKWWSSSSSPLSAKRSIDIQFNIFPLLRTHGVYTIVTNLRDKDNKIFPASSLSIFTKRR
jgi:Cysteine-rich secretory protein family